MVICMNDFLVAFLGGLMLGVSVVGYLLINGRIAGISGLIYQTLTLKDGFKGPAVWFVLGLVITPFFYQIAVQPEIILAADPMLLVIAGLLVGFGTRMGSGCTSGHGICGISRLSPRSMIATLIFMAGGIATVYVIRHLLGGL